MRKPKRGSPAHRAASWLLRPADRVVGGGPRRERFLLRLLGAHYRSAHRRDWRWRVEPPHYYPQRWTAFDIFLRPGARPGPYALARGFFTASVLADGDRMLDIGCGDGFYAARFYTRAEVDAIDIDPDAIRDAERFHPGPRYYLRDAVAEPFPNPPYDVIAWDGALGHFAPDTTDRMLAKIAEALGPGGVFVGSESLGHLDDADHLQFFPDLNSLATRLSTHFPMVQTRELEYAVGSTRRREGFWRCAPGDTARLKRWT